MTTSAYEQLAATLRENATLDSVNALVSWDQETYMVPGAAEARSEQLGLLARLLHERHTSNALGDSIAACEEDVGLMEDPVVAANLRELRRDFELATKLPAELVMELARVGSQSQEAWKSARADNNYAVFQPWLERVLDLTRQKAECRGVPDGGELYDALLDEYEPGSSAKEIESIFTPLRGRLAGLVADAAGSTNAPDESPLDASTDEVRQHAFGQFVLGAMGFDFKRGRLDKTAHPFCTGIAPGDTRLTTRYDGGRFSEALYGSMHEGGHGIYEQGLPKAESSGLPVSQAVSLGIHESQSRLWENLVGRSREFWTWALPHAAKTLSPDLQGVSVEAMYRAVNTAKPTFIRVEADESTYNLHVMMRFEIERALIKGDLSVADLPGAWNEKFKDYLGLDVPNDAVGCLQDVHWSFGLVGYFPTYCLGNLYAAQMWETIIEEIPDLPAMMRVGEFGALRSWLNENVHIHGRSYSASELIMRATGKALSPEPMMRYLEGKIRPIYEA
ncbi:MAG: carboxypeptidase Taq [Planctomycetota bacterium]|jgi:carboxypeptidase Taq